MPKKKNILTLFFLLCVLTSPVLCATPVAEYLCEMGIAYFRTGKYDDALAEFEKALMLEPDNAAAKTYIGFIFQKEVGSRVPEPARVTEPQEIKPLPQKTLTQEEVKPALQPAIEKSEPKKILQLNRDELIGNTLAGLAKKNFNEKLNGQKPDPAASGLKITGEAQASLGITPDNTIWKRANFDLNERQKSWRLTSNDAFNREFNTYDPAIYDSLDLRLDTQHTDNNNKQGFNLHTDLTVDPWSFVGKSNKITVTGSNGDTAEFEMLYWSNTGYIVNHTINTSLRGDSFGIPEIKVKDGLTDPLTVTSYRNSATFSIPSMKIKREFQPVRELWLDYANEQLKFRAFPMAYQDQAYTSDDPLNITNHNIWWKDSMWLRNYTAGNYNSLDTIPSYTKGKWDDSLSYLTKDSTGRYLTALRGFSLNFQPQEETSFDTVFATPKNLWQDYSQVDNIIAAARLKHYLSDNFILGGTFTGRLGYITNPKQKLDSQNFVGGIDLGYEITDGVKAQAEVLTSRSYYDMNNSDYETDSRGNAYYFSFITRYPQKSIVDLKYGYDEIGMDKEEGYLVKSKFYASRMDPGFDAALSDFHDSRQDQYWSRYIHFRKPLEYYYTGLKNTPANWDELNASRIGDGIDIGRSVLGWRIELFLKNKFANLFDVRNVHKEGKFVENVARDEATLKLTDKLTAKALGIYQRMPKTLGGIDPFVYDGGTGEFFLNSAIPDEVDPTIKTGSVGLNYDFFDFLSLNGIYERTNDYTLMYADFPRNVLRNDTTFYGSYYQDNKLYRFVQPFLYSQGLFPQPPYEFYNIFKVGLRLAPLENMEIYLDYTRNEFEAASINSDNMNHVGLEFAYLPTKKIGMVFKYIYSRSKDIDRLQAGITEPAGHHNFFSEFRYLPSKDDELILQYGAGDITSIGNRNIDPYGGTILTLDTQHIIRMYYRRKF